MLSAALRVLSWAFTIGVICFSAGFFGPIILAPGANQGPLLGIFITGPLGFLFGLLIGGWREARGNRESVGAVLARIGVLKSWPPSLTTRRTIAGILGLWFGMQGLAGVLSQRTNGGGGAAIAVLVSVGLLYYAATGRMPRTRR